MPRSWSEAFDLGEQGGHAATDPDAPGREAEEAARRGVFKRLRESLSKSRQALQAELSSTLFDKLDDETWERLEEALILADVGAKTTAPGSPPGEPRTISTPARSAQVSSCSIAAAR